MKKVVLLFSAGAIGLFAQAPTITAVVNTEATTQNAPLCPGILATIYGTAFGSSASAITVTVGGESAYVLPGMGEVSPTQINVQLPYDVSAGPAKVVVTVGGSASAPFSITLQTEAPTLAIYPQLGGIGGFLDAQAKYISNSNLANPGETLTMYPTGLGPTNPPIAAGVTPSGIINTANTPTLTIGGVTAKVLSSTLSSYAGLYQINFVVPDGVQGTVPVVLSIGGEESQPVNLPVFGISAIVNGGSFVNTGTATAEEIVTIYANGLGSKDETPTSFPTTTAQGVSVNFNGTAAPIFALVTENNQLDVIVPTELPSTGTVQVQITTPSGTSPNFPLIMDAAVPGIFLVNDPANATADIAAAQFANTTWLVVPTSAATALGLAQNCTVSKAPAISNCGQPAAPGDSIVLYATGLGEATPKGNPTGAPLATGATAPSDGSTLYETIATPVIQIGGTPVSVLFSGIAPGFAGLYQIDFQVPMGVTEGDSVPITLAMPGSSTGSATMAIHSR
jgi:uncharacterized protein (TIGR03437 family)